MKQGPFHACPSFQPSFFSPSPSPAMSFLFPPPPNPFAFPPPSSSSINYWCYICNRSVSLPSPTFPLRCPRCMHEFLSDRPPSPPPPPPSHFPHRSRSRSGSSRRGLSSSSIKSIPTVRVSEPNIPCAVCKDDFDVNDEARRLPCSHLYHSECIVPWLQCRNSCPVCRSPVGTDNEEGGRNDAREISRRQRPRVRRVEVSLSQLAQETSGSSGPATSGETVSSGRPTGLGFGGGNGIDDDGDTVMSDAR